MNINMRNSDKNDLPSITDNINVAEQDKFLIFESKVFIFPFI